MPKLERTPRIILDERFGDGYRAVIEGKGTNWRGQPLYPALRIIHIPGPGLFHLTDVHFSQAKTVRTLRARLDRFKQSLNRDGARTCNTGTLSPVETPRAD